MTFEVYARGWLERETKYAPYDRLLPTFARNRVPGVGQCHQLKTGAFVLCEKTAKQMQLVGAEQSPAPTNCGCISTVFA